MDYTNWVNKKLDIFFDKNGDRYVDMDIFTEIYDFLSNSDFEEKSPAKFNSVLKDVRDIQNVCVYAWENGIKKGKKKIEQLKQIEQNKQELEQNKQTILNNAKLMKQLGATTKQIQASTGLTEEIIQNL